MIIKAGEYQLQGLSVLELAKTYGTPTYIYDAAVIENKVKTLKEAFEGVNMKIKYACKANTNISVLKYMKTLGVELDVVSPQEMQLAFVAGYSADKVTYTSSGVSFDEIEACVNEGVMVNIDNLPTLEIFGQKYGNSKPVMVRIRPNVLGGGNIKISTGHKDSKFGIAIEQIDQIHALREKYNLKIVGIHQHTGSDVKDPKAFTDSAIKIFELVDGFPDLEIVDLGGGFKVAYKNDDVVTDLKDLASHLVPMFNETCKKLNKDLQLWFEPGKFLVSECGYLLAHVNMEKENPSNTLIGLNTGLNHLIRPMMYDAFHDVINISKPHNTETKEYNVVGYICETDDIAKNRILPQTDAGDIVAIKNAGAYGFVMASQYNARFRPAEVLILNGNAHLIRKRETIQDILANQILIDL